MRGAPKRMKHRLWICWSRPLNLTLRNRKVHRKMRARQVKCQALLASGVYSASVSRRLVDKAPRALVARAPWDPPSIYVSTATGTDSVIMANREARPALPVWSWMERKHTLSTVPRLTRLQRNLAHEQLQMLGSPISTHQRECTTTLTMRVVPFRRRLTRRPIAKTVTMVLRQ